MTRSGTLEYTARAQSQDSSDALRGDIVRGLVELITNADDAYVRANSSGPIRVTIEHLDDAEYSALVSVSDEATGMTADQMVSNLTRLGARSSLFGSGESVRGLHGRGARDLAIFGSVSFEAICEDRYSELRIHGIDWDLTAEDEFPTGEQVERLGLADGQSGLSARVRVRRPNVIPRELAARLSVNAELRHILTEREVTLVEAGMRESPIQRLLYEAPAISRELLTTDVSVPEFEGCTATFRVFELDEPQTGPVGPETHHGILIRGARAVYQNTLFDLENRLGAAYLTGEFICPLIDKIVREYDDAEEAGETHRTLNPFRLLTRSRDGLVARHPLTKSIKSVFSTHLLPQIQEIEARHSGSRGPSETLRSRLDQAARELARLLADDLAELDENPPGNGDDPAPIKLIPGRITIRPNTRKTLTIHAYPERLTSSWDGELEITNDAEHVVELLGIPDPLTPHPENPQLLVSRIRVSALEVEGTAAITVAAGPDMTTTVIRVDPEIPPTPPPPDVLEFSHERYGIRARRRRSIDIAAPLDLVAGHGTELSITHSGHPGLRLLTESCRLRLDEALGWYRGRVSVFGDQPGATGALIAALGDETATASLSVVEPTDPGGLDLKFEWQDTRQGPLRGSLITDPDGLKLVIFGRHPAISHLLGRWDDGAERFEHDDSPEVGLALAEIIASEMAHHVLERDFSRPGRQFDAGTYAAQYRRRLDRYLVIGQRLLARRD